MSKDETGEKLYSARERLKKVRDIGVALAIYPGLPLAGYLAEREGLLPSESDGAREAKPQFLFPIGRREWLQQHAGQIEILGNEYSVRTDTGFTINHPAKSSLVKYAQLTEEPEFILVEGQKVELANAKSDQLDDTGFTIESLKNADGSSETILSTVKTGIKHVSVITPVISYTFYPYLIGQDSSFQIDDSVIEFKGNDTTAYYGIQQIQSNLSNTQFAFTPLVRSQIPSS